MPSDREADMHTHSGVMHTLCKHASELIDVLPILPESDGASKAENWEC